MPTYLERYAAGYCQEVWAELVEMGDQVRDPDVIDDALAVARETMRRARHNLEVLIPRLVKLGYRFGYEWLQPPDTVFGWEQRIEYCERLRWAHSQTPLLSIVTDSEDELADARQRLEQLSRLQAPRLLLDNMQARIIQLEAVPRPAATLQAFEDEFGLLPLSVRAWYELVGSVNFVGMYPNWVTHIDERSIADPELKALEGIPLFAHLEPLHICGLDTSRVRRGHSTKAPAMLEFMPNGAMSYGHQGTYGWTYGVELPCAAADAEVHFDGFDSTFVKYLRTCFHWGGFPGWERMASRPEEDLAYLTANLLSM